MPHGATSQRPDLRARSGPFTSARGAVTAEFVIAMPALLLVLLLAIGAILLSAQRVALTAAAAELVRLEARGDHAAAQARLGALGAGTEVSRSRDGPLLCLTLRAHPGAGALAAVEIRAMACAAVIEEEP